MKNLLILLLFGTILVSCTNEKNKNYITLSGKITNQNSDELSIRNSENTLIKNIAVSEEGVFSDTLHITKGRYSLSDGNEYALLFLQPGKNLKLSLDAEKFDETLTFEGQGSKENNYIIKKLLLQEEVFNNINDLYNLSRIDFNMSLETTKKKFHNFLKEQKDLDTDFILSDIEDTENLFSYLDMRYEKVSKINELIGSSSPLFINYENHNGGSTSLTDLYGKYIYIDVWATWCKPCLAEIPALKELENELGEKIHFVSISIDKTDKHDAWKQMVTDKELKGIQLYADNNWESQFIQDYGIDGIPRFIIIDPLGKIVKPDASRPSNPKTKNILLDLIK